MEDWMKRLFEERDQLQDKVDKLNQFIVTENFLKLSEINRALLYKQITVMEMYLKILNHRISVNSSLTAG